MLSRQRKYVAKFCMKRELEQTNVDEGIGSTIRLGTLLTLLAVPGIMKAKDIEDNLPSRSSVTASSVTTALDRTAPKKTFGGYSCVQAMNVLAVTLYAEARGEEERGMRAVASTIFNRAGGNPDKMVAVCFAEKQYSCWNEIDNKSARTYEPLIPSTILHSNNTKATWELSKKIAWELLSGNFTSTIGKLNSYYNPAKASPDWKNRMQDKQEIGKHLFGYLPEHDPKTKEIRPYDSTFLYRIKKGDRIESLARQYNMSVKELMSANPNLNPRKLQIGQQIRIPKYR